MFRAKVVIQTAQLLVMVCNGSFLVLILIEIADTSSLVSKNSSIVLLNWQ